MKAVPFLLVSFFLFFSCSNSQNLDVSFSDDDTLMALADKKNEDILWTHEIEALRLSKKIESVSGIDEKVSISTELMSLKSDSSVYPVLDGFGELNNSLVSKELASKIESFQKNIISWKPLSVESEEEYSFPLILLKNDIEENWKKHFGVDFPDKKVFTKCIHATPFIGDNGISIPFRFYCRKGFVDINATFNKQSLKVVDVSIIKWGK